MSRVRLAHHERRAQILDVARTLFSEHHYGDVSVDAVAEAAGVTRGLLHHYFGTKRDLYVAVVREIFRASSAIPLPAYVADATPEERLAQSVDLWLDFVAGNRETWFAALGAGGLGPDPEIEAILDRVREAAVDRIVEVLGLDPTARERPEVRAVIRAYGGLAEATTQQWLQHERLTREQAHALLVQALIVLVEDVVPVVQGERAATAAD